MFSKFFKNQLGFSLIQGMVLAAAVAGMAYVGTMTTSDLKMAQKTAESQLRVDQLHKTIYAILQDKGNCERTFLKNGIQPLPYACYATLDGAHQACWAMGGTPGATHKNGEGPCATFVPADTVCLSNNDPLFGSGCNATTMCHGVSSGNSLIGLKNFTQGIWTNNNVGTNSVAPIFRINTNIGTANYDASLMYMNNSVTIVGMELKFPADLATENAQLKITYGKLDKNELSSRSGKGYGGNRIAKDIQIKIQRDPTTKGFSSCYAVTSNTNDRLHQEFCESLSTSGTTTEKLFTWDAATNTCKLNFSCGPSQIFTGWDANGVKKCRNIADWMNLADLLGPSAACDLRTTKPVKLVKVGNKIQINCGASTATTCTSPCNCPNSFDACIGGVCVTQTSTSCSPGVYVKGDSSCQWRCNAAGTAFTCPVGATACGSSPTACSSACDCPGSYDVCDRGICVSKPTGCIDGEVAKGDTTCKWACNSGSWTCPVGGTACGSTTTGGTSGGCFIAGTEVLMANGEKKNIEDIQVGDQLIDVDNKIVTVKTLLPRDYLGEIYSINGGPYFFTPNHPFLSLDGWKSIDPVATKKESPELSVTKLRVGDVLLKKNGIEAILSLDSKPTREKVYNFELDGSHTYLADEYWVHNKALPPDACCPSTGLMVSDCGACPPLGSNPNLCTSPSTLMCAF